ncbi:MAG: nucleotide exchange factor GrpE [Tenericutes bacterium]|nr:nucleotide exchange factor GrpE [Mycoplasmatota bacterium]
MGEDKEKELHASEEAVNEEKELETKVTKEKTKKKKKEKPEDKLIEIEEKLEEFKEKYFRNLADMENYKKRMNEDLSRERKYAGYSLASKLIDSLEIFNQALNMETNDPNLKNFLYGFKMIDDMILNAMKEEGVTIIETKAGDEFDPTKQAAMDKEYDPEKAEHTVLRVVKKGYMFKDRILRPSAVIINIKPEENIKETEENSEENNQD